MQIAPLERRHWQEVAAIYAEGIATRNATFETSVPGWNEWDRAHLRDHRLVATDGAVLGWAALAPVSDRCVYGGVVENSVYVAAAARGRGVGRALLDALVASTEAAGIWTIQTGIFPENESSIRLHERLGFTQVAHFREVGFKFNRWIDVGYWQRLLA